MLTFSLYTDFSKHFIHLTSV